MPQQTMELFNTYNEALAKGDFAGVFATMADTITWHQPGRNPLSGSIKGKEALAIHLGKFAEKSNGTFRVETNWAASNDPFIAASVTFLAEKANGDTLHMSGVDLFRIEEGKIQEVWLFSADQSVEDAYWA